MTEWTRDFSEGRTIYRIHVDVGDYTGAADLVYKLLPQLMVGEEIRIAPAVAPAEAEPALPWA
jgi:hypothetical protein